MLWRHESRAAEHLSPLARRLPLLLSGAFVVHGVVIRLRELVHQRSLWLDEANITTNITERGFLDLTKPLSYTQAAPIGWLWVERAAVNAFGLSEWSLRLFPFLCGVASIVLVWHLARRFLPSTAVPLLVGVVASSPFLVYYSNEVKPYETDVLAGLVLVWLTLRVRDQAVSRSALIAWGSVAAVTVWFSNTAVLLFAGVAAGLLVSLAAEERWRECVLVLVASVPAGASLLLDYVLVLREEAASPELRAFWAQGFLPEPFTIGASADWFLERWASFVSEPLGLARAPLLGFLLILGVGALWKARRWHAVIAAASFLPFVAAAVAGVYPFAGRLVLILVPIALLLIASATWATLPVVRGACWIVLVVAAATSTIAGTKRLSAPTEVEEIRQVLDGVRSSRTPDDVIIVESFARAPFSFYAGERGLRQDALFVLQQPPRQPCTDVADLRAIVGPRRVWAIFGKTEVTSGGHAQVLSRLSLAGRRVTSIQRRGAMAVLFDLGDPPPATARQVPGASPTPCIDVIAGHG